MIQQKGFSLLEVLISLILVSAMALLLLEQHGRFTQLLIQLESQSKDRQCLDQAEESLVVGIDINGSTSSCPFASSKSPIVLRWQ